MPVSLYVHYLSKAMYGLSSNNMAMNDCKLIISFVESSIIYTTVKNSSKMGLKCIATNNLGSPFKVSRHKLLLLGVGLSATSCPILRHKFVTKSHIQTNNYDSQFSIALPNSISFLHVYYNCLQTCD